jgi:hypothetical protein
MVDFAASLTVSAHVQLREAVAFRDLVEPLDCATYYHKGSDHHEVKPGMEQGMLHLHVQWHSAQVNCCSMQLCPVLA